MILNIYKLGKHETSAVALVYFSF